MSILGDIRDGFKKNGVGKMISSAIIDRISDFSVNVLPKLWEAIVKWVIKSIRYAMEKGAIEGFKYFLKNVGKECIEILAEYYLKGDQWYKRTTEKRVSADEVPEDIRRKAEARRNSEIDATPELQEKLELCV